MNFIGFRILKTGIGATLAIIIAKELGIEYAISAGIITILSIENTKKQSVQIAFRRIIAFILAIVISSILFKVFGYGEIIFGLFLIIFIPLAVKLNVKEGIVVSSVLITHLMGEKSVSLFWILNEISILLVGVGIALIFNLFMPNIDKQIKEDQKYIEDTMKHIFLHMANAMRGKSLLLEHELFNNLEKRIIVARTRAYNNLNNKFFTDTSYYVKYMEMRYKQFEIIKRMKEHFQRFFITYEQTIMISNFTEEVANSIYEENTAEKLLNNLMVLRNNFKTMPLPLTREEFENRAMLFQFLNDMEQLLEVKREFKKNFNNKF